MLKVTFYSYKGGVGDTRESPAIKIIRLLKELKKIDRLNAVPIYMYSTAADPRHIDECAALGAKGFIKKQGDIGNLLESLTAILQETRNKVS